MTELQTMLSRAADEAGSFSAPTIDTLRRRAHRQTRFRTATAMVSIVLLVTALAVGLSMRGQRTDRAAHGSDLSTLPGPTGPTVTAHELASYRWGNLPKAPIAGRTATANAWTGSAMLIWGGHDGDRYFDDGASYDPDSRSWSLLPSSPLSARTDSAYAWVSGNLVVWGGRGVGGRRADGARYDPATARWTMLPPAPIDSDGSVAGYAVGSRFVVIYLGGGAAAPIFQAASYDVGTNSWQRLPDLVRPAGHDLYHSVGLGVGATLLLWVDWFHTVDTGQRSTTTSGTDSYALQDGQWSSVPLQPRHGVASNVPLWTGHSVLLADEHSYCGPCGKPYPRSQPGELIDPATGDRAVIPSRDLLDLDYGPVVWTGGALLATATSGTDTGVDSAHPDRSGAWDPGTGTWTPLPSIPFGPASFPVSLWTGSRLLVWSGISSTQRPNSTGGTEFAPSP